MKFIAQIEYGIPRILITLDQQVIDQMKQTFRKLNVGPFSRVVACWRGASRAGGRRSLSSHVGLGEAAWPLRRCWPGVQAAAVGLAMTADFSPASSL